MNAEAPDARATDPAVLSPRALEHCREYALSRRQGLKMFGLVMAAGGLAWGFNRQPALQAFTADARTSTGERRALRPEDGSLLLLNTRTAVDLVFDERRRLVNLVEGELILDMGDDSGQDPPRAFTLRTRDAVLRMRNAQVRVRQCEGGTVVSVRRGEVELRADGVGLGLLPLNQAMLLDQAGQLAPLASHGDLWAWRDGLLSVQQMPLGNFIKELDRYRPGLLRCSEAVAQLPVSGAWSLADTDAVLTALTEALPVKVEFRTRYWAMVSPA